MGCPEHVSSSMCDGLSWSQGVWGGGAAPTPVPVRQLGTAKGMTGAQDEDEVPAEFRHSGGGAGLGDFLISSKGSKQNKNKKVRFAIICCM